MDRDKVIERLEEMINLKDGETYTGTRFNFGEWGAITQAISMIKDIAKAIKSKIDETIKEEV